MVKIKYEWTSLLILATAAVCSGFGPLGFFFPQVSILTRWQAVRRPAPTLAHPMPQFSKRAGLNPNQLRSRLSLWPTSASALMSTPVSLSTPSDSTNSFSRRSEMILPTVTSTSISASSATGETTVAAATLSTPQIPNIDFDMEMKAPAKSRHQQKKRKHVKKQDRNPNPNPSQSQISIPKTILQLPVKPVEPVKPQPLNKEQLEKLILKKHIEKIIEDGHQYRSEIQKAILLRKQQQAVPMNPNETYEFVVENLGSGESGEVRPPRRKINKKSQKQKEREEKKKRRKNKKQNETARIFSSIQL